MKIILIALLVAATCAAQTSPTYLPGPTLAPEAKLVASGRTVLLSWDAPEVEYPVLGVLVAYAPIEGGTPQVIELPPTLHARLTLPRGVWLVSIAYRLPNNGRSEWSPVTTVKVSR